MTSVNETRSAFLDFFRQAGHEVVPSGPLVPRNDPTLMFTSAGMVQFKNLFTGVEKRSYNRATTAQKCLRAGGKHNDLDNVGYTARHHTFFEMLGNFSFGDYFKPVAIENAWNLVTRVFQLNKERLLVTVYHDDDEAFDLWRKIAGLPESRIIRIATSDNFWAAGDNGPCGPCSEIFYDQGEKVWGGPPGSADEDGDRFLEFWNLVFMQYDQLGPGDRVPLPRPSIDTGMGLERISAILQGVTSNYDVDLMRTIIGAVANLTGVDPDGPQAASHRIVADHLRASAFLVADGVDPSNEGRGYVLRRIMRRAMRHTQLLGAAEPLMWRLVPTLVQLMGQAYPELVEAQSAHLRRPAFGGDALPRHAGARPVDPRGRDAGSPSRRPAQRRRRVQALRHLRLSARPDPGGVARPRHRGRRGGLRRRHGAAEGRGAEAPGRVRARPPPTRSGSGSCDRVGRDRVPRLRGRAGREPASRRSCRAAGRSSGWRRARRARCF